MMQGNKIAVKLSLYFAVALLVFSVIISGIFILLLRRHTIELHKNRLSGRAEAIASTVSAYMEGGAGRGNGMAGYGAYFRFLGDIAGTDVWVVDSELNLITSGRGHHGMIEAFAYNYSDLPENAENLIKDVFDDETVFSEDFSGLFSEATLTVGTPVKSAAGDVIGVVLLHSPINGIDEAVAGGVRLLAISIGAALIVAFLLSVWLSRNFTDPIISKEATDALRLEKTRSEFVANISHELKTPITVIRGSLEALADKVVTDPVQVNDYYNRMLNEAKLLQRLVGDLLDLSKLQNTDFVIEKHNILISELLEDTLRSISQIAIKKGVSINVKQDGGCMIYGDYGRIRQMIMIILDNAVKFSPQNGIVDIVLENKVLSVRDYGDGIPEAELPYVFDRFYKSRAEQNKQGTGLGLAIAKQIANRHGIGISVTSKEGGGATFVLKLP